MVHHDAIGGIGGHTRLLAAHRQLWLFHGLVVDEGEACSSGSADRLSLLLLVVYEGAQRRFKDSQPQILPRLQRTPGVITCGYSNPHRRQTYLIEF